MQERPQTGTIPRLRLAAWIVLAGSFLFLYYFYFRPSSAGSGLRSLVETSAFLTYSLYLIVGSIRGFTLIPATNLVLLALPIFPPIPLFFLTLLGILISSASIYYFSESLHLDQYFERRHQKATLRVKTALERNPTTIVTVWSFFPLVPTDLICYVCGVMRISFARFLLGVLVGEGAICALYIFTGNQMLRMLGIGRAG